MKHINALSAALMILAALAAASTAFAKVRGATIEYRAGGRTMKGYLAFDDTIKEKRPAVIVVHEWWGLNDYARRRAAMLAELGYVALAVDMYGEGRQAADPETATRLSSAVMKNFGAALDRFNATLDYLKKQPVVNAKKIAAVGYCFGGGVALNAARQGADLRGVVSFHGNLVPITPAVRGTFKARVLVLNGGADRLVTAEQIAAFRKEMTGAGADYRFIDYPGALHAFSNPDATALGKKFKMPIAYNADADRKSWDEMKKFLADLFSR